MTSKLNGHRNIYDVVKKEKLDVVNQPINKAHGLPNECYNSKEYTIIERKKIICFSLSFSPLSSKVFLPPRRTHSSGRY